MEKNDPAKHISRSNGMWLLYGESDSDSNISRLLDVESDSDKIKGHLVSKWRIRFRNF